ncbi:prepilin-type N-terminal cleavage/methylation domain-containing protein [Geomicrobium sp. JCM 19055]|uniref:prepilin-type N-terminal cleavage/methylation domain-containing protein n=1 Tax=Geomicrobium sp. JCM 19055 TaxID=1460649 RepID=UPI00045ED1F1|nr:prepilin-type N-terminal cleavage/methylation domain-containing protein [Geomicrobium sp. JCM 19055]GAJ98588.1 hypothetical protein JCM19055_1531 [Geomicrobium sp. JCM 19055]
MLNQSQGFTLIEVVSALLLLSILSASIVPVLHAIYEERADVSYEFKAISMLISDEKATGTMYLSFTDGEAQCFSWEHWRKRERSICLEVP